MNDYSSIEQDVVENHRLVLTITYPDKVVEKEITVNAHKKISFGSSEMCDIILTDSSIAPYHFSFIYDETPQAIEFYANNTLYKDNCFYAGVVKIKIEKFKAQDYLPVSAEVFKIITNGFSVKKSIAFFLSLIFIYYFASLSDNTFFSNEDNSSDIAYYFTLWIMPNLLIMLIGIFYIIYTYFSTNKKHRAFIKVIQQHILKYSIKLSFIYVFFNILLYTINGFISIRYTMLMQAILIYSLFLISKKIIHLNQYTPAEKKKVTKTSYIYFCILFIATQVFSFSTNYITWIPILPSYRVDNNQDLEQKANDFVKDIKSSMNSSKK